MPVRTIDPNRREEDWEGNNLALTCPLCGKVFVVSGFLHEGGQRNCPRCNLSIGRITGGRVGGGQAEIEWPNQGDGQAPLSLGLIPIPERTLQHDLDVSNQYQAFSGELLRLALLGLAGIGFLLVSLDPGGENGRSTVLAKVNSFDQFLYVALFCFGFCAALALAHRYWSSDSLAYHLEYLRLSTRGTLGDQTEAKDRRLRRNRRFRVCGWLILAAAALLGIGAISLSLGFSSAIQVISKDSQEQSKTEDAPHNTGAPPDVNRTIVRSSPASF
jgi:hypothetical protein